MENKGTVVVIVTLVVVIAILLGFYVLAPQLSPSTQVVFETSMGDFTVELYEDMPITSGNFQNLVEEKFYDGIVFHRIVPGFVIQAGDPSTKGANEVPFIKDEKVGDHSNKKYTISMANAGRNTGSSQFFINLKDNIFLDSAHPVFGEVVEGQEVIDAIAAVPTEEGDVPIIPVVISRAYLK